MLATGGKSAGRLPARALLALIASMVSLACASVALPESISGGTSFEGKTVTGILFEPAAQPYSRDEMLNKLPLKIGQPFRDRELHAAIQNLFSTGRFVDIAVDASPSGKGMVLKFITKRAYFVGRVTVEGVKEPPNRGQLIGDTKLLLGRPFTEPDKQQAIESLRDSLRRNGYYNAVISAGTDYDADTQQVDLDFQIDSGDRAKFQSPAISGAAERSVGSIIRSTGWQRIWGLLGWQPVTEARVQQGIDNIRRYYQKKDHLMARVNLRQLQFFSGTNTVKPVIDIDAGPAIEIDTEGMHIRGGKLKQLVPVYQERAVDRDLLVEGQRNLVQYLQSEGYFEADVDFTQHSENSGTRTVTYGIEKGERHKLTGLSITGNHYFDLQTIRERMVVTPASIPRYPHGRYSAALLSKDITAIKDLYRNNGFRNAVISSKVVDDYQGKTGDVGVFISIDEGIQTFVSHLTMEGTSPAEETHIRSTLRSLEGQPFSEVNVASDRENILNYYYDNGYVNATFDYYIDQTSDPYLVNLRFVINTGEQKFVRDVLIEGLDTTRPNLVLQRIHLEPNAPLSLAQNTDSERRLYDLGIFARVNTAIQNPDGQEDKKYVLYQLEEARHYSLNVGVGAEVGRIGGGTSLNAPAGAAGFSPRLTLGITRLNFAGLGHTISLQSLLSNVEQRGIFSYIAPQFAGSENLNLTFSALYDSSHDIRTFSAVRREASVQLGQKLSRANSLQYRLVFRRVTQGDLLIDPLLVPLIAQPVRVGLLGASFIQDKRDDPTDAHRGSYTTIDLGYAAGFLASQTQFARTAARNSTYYQLTRNLILARSTYFGWIQRVSGRQNIPLSERFFAGGATSQRAFPENQAGPRDTKTGFPIGGGAVLTNNVELRFPLIGDNVGGVLFEDAGNVYSDVRDISFRYSQKGPEDFNYMVHAVGFGIRYRTPIGPVRVDLSFSPNSPEFKGLKGSLSDFLDPNIRPHLPTLMQRINQFQFHFSLGQAF